MSLSSAHEAAKTHFYTLTNGSGKLLFPEPGQVMYAPNLNQAILDDPQGAVNKIGFAIAGTEGETLTTYKAEMQCILTYPETKTDDQYIESLAHVDSFLKAVNNVAVTGVGMLTRIKGPTPVLDMSILGIRIDFNVTSITID